MKYLIYYKDISVSYETYGAELSDSLAKWAISVRWLKKNRRRDVIMLSYIELTDEEAERWENQTT